MNDARPVVHVFATLPPPVTGMTVVTGKVLEEIGERCGTAVFNISHGRRSKGASWVFVKAVKSLAAPLVLAARRPRRGACVYTVANSGWGILYNVLLAAAARLLGLELYVHHHVYSYVREWDFRMALLSRIIGDRGRHVLLCDGMVRAFRLRYPAARDCIRLRNGFVMEGVEASPPPPSRDGPLRIGHIGKLSPEKGFDTVLETFDAVREKGIDARLLLAGPLGGAGEGRLLEEARDRHGDRVEYRGALYGEAKWDFYRGIDVMLFPTRYRKEAQPLVVVEAFFFGVPVIAAALACIPDLVGEEGGFVVDPGDHFPSRAAAVIGEFARSPEKIRDLSAAARRRSDRFAALSRADLALFLDRLAPGAKGAGERSAPPAGPGREEPAEAGEEERSGRAAAAGPRKCSD